MEYGIRRRGPRAPAGVPENRSPLNGPARTDPPVQIRSTDRASPRYGSPARQQSGGSGLSPPLQNGENPGDGCKLRDFPLGGFEQVCRNCFVVEVDQDIFLIDLGL